MNQIKKVLIAIEDGPGAEKVASHGYGLAQQLTAAVALVSVVDTTALMTDGGVPPGEIAESLKNDYRKTQQMIVKDVFKNESVWTFVEKGKPSECILRVAEEWEADLIVLGTHGRTGLAHFFIGDAAEKVMRHSVKPLFVVPIK